MSVIHVVIEKIKKSKRIVEDLSRFGAKDNPQKILEEDNIKYCQSVLAKFVGCEDFYIQQIMIPYLRREDLIFAAPVASKLGLQRLLDQYMNGVGVDSKNYSY